MTLYLTYRPTDFTNLVGQEFITNTLKKTIADDKTVGAYLFTGPRGTGKTSSARIFAKALNCKNIQNGNPCSECEICKEFSDNSLIDIIEIDAASHTGVDNIREIIEQAQFQPTKATYKVYIIDEVHMLSKGAFNALLKILEEPPKHVKFILATTEIHKVPDTILSRCQRYDFRSISDSDIRSRLEYIAHSENILVDDKSYAYIIKQAEGGLRNAISLFEQLVHENTIEYSHIVETLGIVGSDLRDNFLHKLIQKDPSIFGDFSELEGSGKNLKIFFKELTHNLQETSIQKIQAGENINSELQLLEILQDTLQKLKNSVDESLTLKTALLKILSGNTSLKETETPKNNISPTNIPEKNIQKPKDDILSQAQDIFSMPSEAIVSKPVAQDVFENPQTSESTNSNFDIEAFIKACKSAGAKAATTMSLRAATIDYTDTVLRITCKTQIASASLSKNEAKEFMQRAGESLGMIFSKIEIK